MWTGRGVSNTGGGQWQLDTGSQGWQGREAMVVAWKGQVTRAEQTVGWNVKLSLTRLNSVSETKGSFMYTI